MMIEQKDHSISLTDNEVKTLLDLYHFIGGSQTHSRCVFLDTILQKLIAVGAIGPNFPVLPDDIDGSIVFESVSNFEETFNVKVVQRRIW